MVDENSVAQQAPAAAEQVVLRERSRALLERLVETYPLAFFGAAERKIKPLKRNIHKELSPVVREWGFEVRVLKYALGGYTRQLRYQQALLDEARRIDLLGQPVEEVSATHRQLAQDRIQQILASRRSKRATRPRKPKKPAVEITEQAVATLQQKLSRKAVL
jgi:sRNA-binding protein